MAEPASKLTERLRAYGEHGPEDFKNGKRLLREAAAALEQAEKDVAALALDNAELLSQGAARGRTLKQAEQALARLASMEAFDAPRAINKSWDSELMARIEFAREALTSLGGQDRQEQE